MDKFVIHVAAGDKMISAHKAITFIGRIRNQCIVAIEIKNHVRITVI